MPNTKSAIKRLRQSERRRVQNKAVRSRLRTAVKRVRTATDAAQAAEYYRDAASLLDRAASRGIIHDNTASRSKARLAAHVHRLGAES
ncbi:MAG: 30S ribosomal protein S20 [Gemmatimonadetes bacterium]|uniref:Small ribosomal subunit protein bS20 n=1 Tax=Candidatus Kutchimonas denitrificans TaxID=3056748 RepID=A0AAE5CDL1_9BACT|nr:30S ribosomal protein S20 [Gemmatimonadota bacterium]NIR76004.1 30S ribosomal protein S20 [Candidatus Kutchimonas denitrificans]NIS02196.1 30S ribosomal protein S20 [Gemmatimonadota bacterium]NIT68022.1 30S ribosomal protein S20 [Gemmatimonadota bacterium]NIU54048.1 30S ribosomal protein S20 [Gemmatimonadota bacterium]